MDEEKARLILVDYIQDDNRLYRRLPYVNWDRYNRTTIDLEGDFHIDEIEALAWWMRNKGIS